MNNEELGLHGNQDLLIKLNIKTNMFNKKHPLDKFGYSDCKIKLEIFVSLLEHL